ncbi:MAG: thioredoxin family protein [Bacteroidota bacterium]
MDALIQEKIEKSFDYAHYRTMVAQLLSEGKTTGPNQSEDYIFYTQLNQQRMDRLDKRLKLSPAWKPLLENLSRRYTFLTITEAWCGDAAQNLPIIDAIAQQSDKITHHLVLRDEHLELMDRYLTGGARSIPKTIFFDADTGEELGTWGPRPAEAQKMVMAYKALPEPKPPYTEFVKGVQLWYAKNRTVSTQEELLTLLREFEKV